MAASGNRSKRFPDTRWSLVGRAAASDDLVRQQAITELLMSYMPGLRSFLVETRRLSADLAEELLQDFVSDRVLAAQLVSKADEARGRFRNFLLKSLNNFVATQLERLRRTRRRDLSDELLEALAAPLDADAFDREWITLVVSDALEQMQNDCKTRDRMDLWEVLQIRVVDPMLHGKEPVGYQEIVRRFDLGTPRKAMLLLVSAKRCFVRHLRLVVGKYVQGQERVDEEIDDLRDGLER